MTLDEFRAQDVARAAAERAITILREALVRVRDYHPDAFARIDRGTEFIRFRNRLVHMYDLMNEEEIWMMIETYLPDLLVQIEAMLAQINP